MAKSQRFLNVGLENPRDAEVLHIVAPNFPGRVKARLRTHYR